MRVLVTTDRQDGGGFLDGPRVRPRHPRAWVKEAVIDAVRQAGGVPLLLPPGETDLEAALEGIHAVVITGGDFDIHPRHYKAEPHPKLGNTDDKRTATELALATLALDNDIRVLGICGGMQALAVAAGGTLVQDIEADVPGAAEHQQPTDPSEGWHRLVVRPGMLRRLIGPTPVVNSTHHQAVDQPGGLRVAALAEDGVVEAVEAPDHRFCLGVQWHPELLGTQGRLFRALLS
jgi:putative glutamine amidotransferase